MNPSSINAGDRRNSRKQTSCISLSFNVVLGSAAGIESEAGPWLVRLRGHACDLGAIGIDPKSTWGSFQKLALGRIFPGFLPSLAVAGTPWEHQLHGWTEIPHGRDPAYPVVQHLANA
jgi:hypothetical protein